VIFAIAYRGILSEYIEYFEQWNGSSINTRRVFRGKCKFRKGYKGFRNV